MNPIVIAALVWFVLTPVFLVLWLVQKRKLRSKTADAESATATHRADLAKLAAEHEATKAKYSGIISQEAEVARLQGIASTLTSDINALRKSYAEKRAHFDRLESQVAIYDERLAFAELGIYEPHFDFTDSEEFKAKIVEVQGPPEGDDLGKAGGALPTEWTVEGSKAKGATMINRQMRLTMRAFNNECEAAMAICRWNNVVAMEKRVLSAAA